MNQFAVTGHFRDNGHSTIQEAPPPGLNPWDAISIRRLFTDEHLFLWADRHFLEKPGSAFPVSGSVAGRG